MPVSLEQAISALKGVQGTGSTFGRAADLIESAAKRLTLEPGDFSRGGDSQVHISAPLAYDLWYLFNDVNLIHHIDPNTDSEVYVDENLSFLEEKLSGLKPLRSLTYGGLMALREGNIFEAEGDWVNEGSYFVQVAPFEMCQVGSGFDFDSDGPAGFSKEDFVGHITFPVGQLGVMEVVSMFQETWLDSETPNIPDDEVPSVITDTEMFAPMEGAGENKCYGWHLIEDGYLIPEAVKGQFEIMANANITKQDYTQEISPKRWMRLWVKKEDVWPVPGEFIGILVKPLSVPPHVWWFQESTPLLYAGNWMETQNLTSGVITMVTLEAARTDGGIGNEYWVKVNGIEFIAYASDFKLYAVGDRVGVLKRWTVMTRAARSFTWKDQRDGTHPTKNEVSLEFMIMPVTFYVGQ